MHQYLISVYEDGHLQLEGNTESGFPWNTKYQLLIIKKITALISNKKKL